MEISDDLLRNCTKKVLLSRMRILMNNGFYGLLLIHVKMSLSEDHETFWTDGKERIFVNPKFLLKLSDSEIDYCLMHVLLHIVLRHSERSEGFIKPIYDKAADIVVNSNILKCNHGNKETISLASYGGEQPYLTPQMEAGWKYTAEEIYEQFEATDCNMNGNGEGWDFHEKMENDPEIEVTKYIWQERIQTAAEIVNAGADINGRGVLPGFAERYLQQLRNPQIDWRTILDEFLQIEINDYSFTPPDKRFDNGDFFLPDYNEEDFKPEKMLFMIDTSGSMTNKNVSLVYEEVRNAIDMFGGMLEGWLGFFDASVIDPVPFSSMEEFDIIRPFGGGGTRFDVIFDYVKEYMMDELPASIIIMTDGYAEFPPEAFSMGIPVLWVIVKSKVVPPWGKVARIESI